LLYYKIFSEVLKEATNDLTIVSANLFLLKKSKIIIELSLSIREVF